MKKILTLLFAGSFLFSVGTGSALRCLACVPPVSREQMEESTRLLARYSTEYSEKNKAREHNLKLACKRISGTVLPSGKEFSFNERVGERTKKNGFEEATVISCGEYVLGVGGGVCQVSSTLFCCALHAGMKITESRAHSLASSYVPFSLDAMVSRMSDLKFVNASGAPVFFKMRAEKGRVTAELYGLSDGKYYETESVVLYYTLPEEDVVEEGTCDEIVREGKRGVVSESYLLTYDRDGTLLSRRLIRKDSYAPIRGIVRKKKQENQEKVEETEEKTVAFTDILRYNN